MNPRTIIPALIAAALATSALTTPASAGGFIGDIVKGIYPGTAPIVDGVDDYLAHGGTMQAKTFPAPTSPVMGNRCATPAGIFAPGPWNPVGAPCHGNGPYGPVFGQVIQ